MMLLNPYALATGGGGAVSARYWQITGIAVIDAGFFEVSEIQLLTGTTVVSEGKTYSSQVPPDGFTIGSLFDGNTTTRCYWTATHAEDPAFYIRVDLGTAMAVDGVKQGGYDTADRYMTDFTLQYSNDASSWTTLGSKTGLAYPGNNTLSSTYTFP